MSELFYDDGEDGAPRKLGRAFLQGALGGFGDEATAGVAGALSALRGGQYGQSYDDIVKAERRGVRDFQKENPVAAYGTEILGSLLPASALGKGAKALGWANSASKAARAAVHPITQGAVLGGVSGAGAADESSRGTGAAVGSIIGGGVTTILGAAGKGLQAIARHLGISHVDKEVAARLLEAMKQDGLDPSKVLPEIAQVVRSTQKPFALADYFANKKAPNTVQLITEGLGKSGQHQQRLFDHLEQRLATQKDRVLFDMSDAMNKLPQSVRETIQEMIERRSKIAGPDYAEAFKNKTRLNAEELQALHETGAVDDAFKRLLEVASKGDKSKAVPVRWATDTELESIPKALLAGARNDRTGRTPYYSPTLEQYHQLKGYLWELAENAKIKPATAFEEPKASKLSMAYDAARVKLRDYLRQIGGDAYTRAETAFAGESELIEAARTGARLFKDDPAKLKQALAAMSDAEREAMLGGFAGYVQGLPLREGQDFAKQLINDSNKLERLRMLMPTEDAFNRLLGRLRTESMLTTGAKAYAPAAAGSGLPNLADAANVMGAAQGNRAATTALLASARRRLGSMPEREGARLTEYAFGQPGHRDFSIIDRALAHPPSAGPYRPAMGEAASLITLDGRDPDFAERLDQDLQELRGR